jgi:hypothetical protein
VFALTGTCTVRSLERRAAHSLSRSVPTRGSGALVCALVQLFWLLSPPGVRRSLALAAAGASPRFCAGRRDAREGGETLRADATRPSSKAWMGSIAKRLTDRANQKRVHSTNERPDSGTAGRTSWRTSVDARLVSVDWAERISSPP